MAAHAIAKQYKYAYGSFQNEKEPGNKESDGFALQMAAEEVLFGAFLGNCEVEASQVTNVSRMGLHRQ